MWYGKAMLIILTATLGVRVASLVVLCLYAVPGDKSIMVATLPNGMESAVLVWITAIALIVCVGVYIWRYAEYNAAKGQTRQTNRMSPKFLGALILAIAASTYTAYFLAAPLVDMLNFAEPVVSDYITMGAFAAILSSIGFVVLFTEGINGFAKFIGQGVKDIRANSEKIVEELEIARAELAELRAKYKDD
jgi:hypothetical protein